MWVFNHLQPLYPPTFPYSSAEYATAAARKRDAKTRKCPFVFQVVFDGHVRVSGRQEVLLRGDDRVRAQLPPPRSVAAGLEDHDRMPHILTRVVASIPCRLRLFVVASHCFFTFSTPRQLPPVYLTDGSKWSVYDDDK